MITWPDIRPTAMTSTAGAWKLSYSTCYFLNQNSFKNLNDMHHYLHGMKRNNKIKNKNNKYYHSGIL